MPDPYVVDVTRSCRTEVYRASPLATNGGRPFDVEQACDYYIIKSDGTRTEGSWFNWAYFKLFGSHNDGPKGTHTRMPGLHAGLKL